MNKTVLILCILYFFAVQAQASEGCKDSDGGNNPHIAGAIHYRLLSESCNDQGCRSYYLKDHDLCLNAQTLREYYCQDGQPKMIEIACATKCKAAACTPAKVNSSAQ